MGEECRWRNREEAQREGESGKEEREELTGYLLSTETSKKYPSVTSRDGPEGAAVVINNYDAGTD
jgi:hypothetical protein